MNNNEKPVTQTTLSKLNLQNKSSPPEFDPPTHYNNQEQNNMKN